MAKSWAWLMVALVCAWPAGALADASGGMDATKWHEDLAVLREQMPKTHANLFHTMTREQFEGALDALENSLPDLTASQVKAGILRVVAMVNDGHTRVRPESLGNHYLPLRLHFFPDGLYVVAADKGGATLVGGKVEKIGPISAQDAYAAVRPLIPVDRDNEGRRRWLAVDLLATLEVLQAIGATKSADSVDFTVANGGRETTATVTAGEHALPSERGWPMKPEGWIDAREHASHPVPLWAQHPDKHYWHAFLASTNTLYVQYNQVEDEPGGESIAAYFPRVFR
jgi:hypothetical protein